MKRVFLIVLDSCGIGEMPDAAAFGDADCNTLQRISSSPEFSCDNMVKLGLGCIDGIEYLPTAAHPLASVARLAESSKGKDTTIGHWEIAGLTSSFPLPTYPDGFPDAIMNEFVKATGREYLCNRPYSGTDVIRDYGEEHMKTGKLIVYTSADSVFQIAAHEDVVPPEQLYEYCRIARRILTGVNGVGRVIARPFIGSAPNFTRTARRHDFSLEPPGKTMLDAISDAGKTVYAIGKIRDIFAGKGITRFQYTTGNEQGMSFTLEALEQDFNGLCFVNLVDFDMLYGHRQDIDGYAAAFSEFDKWLPSFIQKMRPDDALIITADHGCDPGDNSTDHSREYVPFLMYSPTLTPYNFGTKETFSCIAATVTDLLDVPFKSPGVSLRKEAEI